ncbi:MAG: glycoside hydrolase family 32 protein [Tepidisphaerales bacterium]
MQRYRPRWHVSGRPWMNDPIPFYWEGDWHVFFQHNPAGPSFGEMCWGHVVSRDLVHWALLPPAIVPSRDGCDRRGCWTGSVIGALGGFWMFYTAIAAFEPELRQTQALATSEDLLTWEKYAGNPVVHGKPAGVPGGAGNCFRDPCVWAERDGSFAMAVGGEAADGSGGRLLLYRSDDLLRWRYAGVMYAGTPATGRDFECPDVFELDGRAVLLSSRGRTWAHVGERVGDVLRIERAEPLEGERFYAGKTASDGRRRLLWGWVMDDGALPGEPTSPEVMARGWAGVLSLPRELYWTGDGRLGQRPVAELAALRKGPADVREGLGRPGEALWLEGVGEELGASLELEVHAGLDGAEDVLEVVVRADGRTGAGCAVRVGRGWLESGAGRVRRGPGAEVTLRVYVDVSVVEAFCDGAAVTARTYPARPDAGGVYLRGTGGVVVRQVRVWPVG